MNCVKMRVVSLSSECQSLRKLASMTSEGL